ncbi:hypothetical protein LXM50_13995 [Microbacterium sp. Au-Mic1]|uniref:hypothetical protein n=1 Tax=Microbacterium sp. Au-Mic1 TaxID=2906457 RepID=UPI001E477C4F|nr:hypothetical protein [Microbacterium sp. Au-Mic1]MCE4027087.1 hypothetical protein [Microbacterium sp. Au-Mic1]
MNTRSDSVAESALVCAPVELLRPSGAANASLMNRAWHRGELIRVMPGVYAETRAWRELPRWSRYLAQVHAVAMKDPNAVFCGLSAAALRGVYLGRVDEPIHVLEPLGSSRIAGRIRIHTGALDRAIEELDGTLLTGIPDTIVDVARSVPPIEGLAYADALLRRTQYPNPEQLRAINESRNTSRGRRNARWALERATGVPESPLESLSLGVMESAGFEIPELQVEFRLDGYVDRADFFWPSRRLIGEADGGIKYDGTLQDPTGAILREKRRDSRLRRQASGLMHWGWSEVRDSDLLTTILANAGVPRPHRRDAALLATLRDLA